MHVIPIALGIVREPTAWVFMTSQSPAHMTLAGLRRLVEWVAREGYCRAERHASCWPDRQLLDLANKGWDVVHGTKQPLEYTRSWSGLKIIIILL